MNHSYWNSKEPNGIEPAEKPHEECGVFGLYGDDVMPPAYAAYNGLLALQHRGQESCGIAVNDRGVVSYHKDMGLVSEVFHPKDLDKLSGQMCVSHVRYSTAGDSVPENAQPLVMRYIKGTLAIAHNGNLTNAHEIRRELEHRGAIFQTTIDSEVIAYIIARERMHSGSIEEAVRRTMPQIQGAYSLLVMRPQKLIAARDPNGFRPLCMGRLGKGYVFASETCAMDACGAEFVRDEETGENAASNENQRSRLSEMLHCLKEKITGSKIGMVVAVLVVLAVLPFIFKLVTGTVGGFFWLAVALAAILVVLGLMTVLVFVGGIMLFVLGAASLFEHFAMGLMFIGLGIAAEGSCLLLICGCILFYGVFLPWAVKGIIQLCRQAAGYLSARA